MRGVGMGWSRRAAGAMVTTAAALWLALSAGSAEEKQLSVYAPQAQFTVRVSEHEGREYVDLMSVVGPLTNIKVKVEGDRARFSGGAADGLFVHGENNVRVGKNRVRFPGKVMITEGRVQVPVVVLPALLQEMARLRTELHEPGRRLFVENTQTHFSVELKKTELKKEQDAEVVLAFPMRVNPNITQEGNKVRLVFRQEPVVMTQDGMSFNDAHITGLRFEEKNGAAEITISGSAPLLVSFSDQGKTLSIKLAPAAAVVAPPLATASPAPTAAEPVVPPTVAPAPTTEPTASPFPFDSVRYVVIIDAGHGGTDPGVKFSDRVIEKDITLALAKRLRTELQNRGVPALLAREGDQTLSYDQRAITANGQRAAVYVTLHAGGLGSGVRVYATVMPQADTVEGPFVPWQRAQETYRERSQFLARVVANEVRAKKIPARMLNAAIPPLHAIAAPAIAIEVAPPKVGAAVEEFDKVAYQVAIVGAVATAIVNSRNKLGEMR